MAETVFNGFILRIPFEPVSLHQHPHFFRKAALAVMRFLLGDVPGDLTDPGVRHREHPVAAAPGELARQESLWFIQCEEAPLKRCIICSMDRLVGRSTSTWTWSGLTWLSFI